MLLHTAVGTNVASMLESYRNLGQHLRAIQD